jgi:hypothetical protein
MELLGFPLLVEAEAARVLLIPKYSQATEHGRSRQAQRLSKYTSSVKAEAEVAEPIKQLRHSIRVAVEVVLVVMSSRRFLQIVFRPLLLLQLPTLPTKEPELLRAQTQTVDTVRQEALHHSEHFCLPKVAEVEDREVTHQRRIAWLAAELGLMLQE